jgi:hypothetical protein
MQYDFPFWYSIAAQRSLFLAPTTAGLFFLMFFHLTFPAAAGLDVRCSFSVFFSIDLADSAASAWADT